MQPIRFGLNLNSIKPGTIIVDSSSGDRVRVTKCENDPVISQFMGGPRFKVEGQVIAQGTAPRDPYITQGLKDEGLDTVEFDYRGRSYLVPTDENGEAEVDYFTVEQSS
jgi:hypothetical protein